MNPFEKQPGEEKIKMTSEMMEKSFVKLNGLTSEMAREINETVAGGKKIINPEGHIKMSSWNIENNDGIFPREEIQADNEHLYRKKKMWAGIDSERRMEDWKNRRGLTDEKGIVEQYEKDRKKSKPALLESATTVLFYKILKERFLVVKSSEWDDYENAADNIIIDKQTGEIVGMFDEVGGEVKGEVKDRGEKEDKQVKIIKKAIDGGSKIKYGLTFEKNEDEQKSKLIKKSFENIPIFYLSVKLEDLGDLIDSVGNNLNDSVGVKGLKFFDDFIASLESQADLLQTELGKKENFKNSCKEGEAKKVSVNIESFRKSLEEMKKLRSKF